MAFCPKCDHSMDANAIICPHCQYDFPMNDLDDVGNQRRGLAKGISQAIFAPWVDSLLFCLGILGSLAALCFFAASAISLANANFNRSFITFCMAAFLFGGALVFFRSSLRTADPKRTKH